MFVFLHFLQFRKSTPQVYSASPLHKFTPLLAFSMIQVSGSNRMRFTFWVKNGEKQHGMSSLQRKEENMRDIHKRDAELYRFECKSCFLWKPQSCRLSKKKTKEKKSEREIAVSASSSHPIFVYPWLNLALQHCFSAKEWISLLRLEKCLYVQSCAQKHATSFKTEPFHFIPILPLIGHYRDI